jgi:hypothetical protein
MPVYLTALCHLLYGQRLLHQPTPPASRKDMRLRGRHPHPPHRPRLRRTQGFDHRCRHRTHRSRAHIPQTRRRAWPARLDGTAIPLTGPELRDAKRSRQEHVNVKFWGRAVPEGIYGFSVDEGKMRSSPSSSSSSSPRPLPPCSLAVDLSSSARLRLEAN